MASQRIPVSLNAGYSFDAMTSVPDGWPAEFTAQGIHWTHPQFKLPLACAAGSQCSYKCGDKVCVNVHPGEEGTGLHFCAARTVSKKVPIKDAYARVLRWEWQTVSEPACVRYCGSSTFYERRRLRLSWPEWCARVGRPVAPVALPKTEEERKEALGETLYPIVRQAFFENLDVMESNSLLTAQTTPGKLVGMLIDGCEIAELEQMVTNTDLLAEFLCDGVYVLHERYPAGVHPQLMCY